MFGNLKNLNNLRKQAQQLKQELEKETFIGSAEGGKIQITMNGNQEILAVEIDSEILKPENKEKIEKGVKSATGQAISQMQMMMARKMQGGMF